MSNRYLLDVSGESRPGNDWEDTVRGIWYERPICYKAHAGTLTLAFVAHAEIRMRRNTVSARFSKMRAPWTPPAHNTPWKTEPGAVLQCMW